MRQGESSDREKVKIEGWERPGHLLSESFMAPYKAQWLSDVTEGQYTRTEQPHGLPSGQGHPSQESKA